MLAVKLFFSLQSWPIENGDCRLEPCAWRKPNVEALCATWDDKNLRTWVSWLYFLILYHFFCGQDIILSHLLERYLNNQIYTYIGDILIAVNPLQTLNLYGPEVSVQKFFITVFQLPANYFVSVFSSNIWRTIFKEPYYFQLYHSKIYYHDLRLQRV